VGTPEQAGVPRRQYPGSQIVNFMPIVNSTSSIGTSSDVTPTDENLQVLDLAYNVTISADDTSYFIQYFKLPSDK